MTGKSSLGILGGENCLASQCICSHVWHNSLGGSSFTTVAFFAGLISCQDKWAIHLGNVIKQAARDSGSPWRRKYFCFESGVPRSASQECLPGMRISLVGRGPPTWSPHYLTVRSGGQGFPLHNTISLGACHHASKAPIKIHPLQYLQISVGGCILVSWRLTRPSQQSLLGQHKFREDLNLNTFRQRNGSPMGHIFTIPSFFLYFYFILE